MKQNSRASQIVLTVLGMIAVAMIAGSVGVMAGRSAQAAPRLAQPDDAIQIPPDWQPQQPVAVWPAGDHATSVSLVPRTTKVKAGESFEVNVAIAADVVTRGAQAGLKFDPKLFEADGQNPATEGTFYSSWALSNKAETVMIPCKQDNSNGRILAGAVAVMGGPDGSAGPTGKGNLLTFHLKAKSGVSGRGSLEVTDVTVSGITENGTVADAPNLSSTGAEVEVVN